jgi:hypothetical protein
VFRDPEQAVLDYGFDPAERAAVATFAACIAFVIEQQLQVAGDV